MVQLTLLSGPDGFNRVLACRDAFLAQIVRSALALARSVPADLGGRLPGHGLARRVVVYGRTAGAVTRMTRTDSAGRLSVPCSHCPSPAAMGSPPAGYSAASP